MKIKVIQISALRNATPRRVDEATAFLDTLQPSIVITRRDLASALGITTRTLGEYAGHWRLAGYRHRTERGELYWGSRRAIAKLKQLLKQHHREPATRPAVGEMPSRASSLKQ